MPLILGTNSIKDATFNVSNSVRLEDGYFTRQPSSSGSNTTWTFSCWLKRSVLGIDTVPWGTGYSSPQIDEAMINIGADNKPRFNINVNDQTDVTVQLSRVLRDVSAWYHIVCACDTTQGTASNRVKFYINGALQTDLATEDYPTQNQSTFFGDTNKTHIIAQQPRASANLIKGYLAEVVFIDGTALDATSFGEYDEDSPFIWKPKNVSGLTFGTNGFYQQYKESGTGTNASGFGADTSGNGNHFASNNLASTDQSTDTCTNNFAIMNSILVNTSAESSFAEGGLQVSTTDSGAFGAVSTIGVSSGKWYWEVKPTQIQNKNAIGVTAAAQADAVNNHRPGDGAFSVGLRSSGDVRKNGSSESGSWDSFGTSDIVGVALDLDNDKLYFSKNGTFMNSGDPTSGSTGTGAISLTDPASTTDGFYFFAFGDPGQGAGTANIAQFNFGSPPYAVSSGNADGEGFGNFEHAPPSGYFALCTKNLAEYG